MTEGRPCECLCAVNHPDEPGICEGASPLRRLVLVNGHMTAMCLACGVSVAGKELTKAKEANRD